jgi:hypothetical protein
VEPEIGTRDRFASFLQLASVTLLEIAGAEMSRAADEPMQHPHGGKGGSEKRERGEKEGRNFRYFT